MSRHTYLLSTFTPKTVVWYIIVPSKRHQGIKYLIIRQGAPSALNLTFVAVSKNHFIFIYKLVMRLAFWTTARSYLISFLYPTDALRDNIGMYLITGYCSVKI